MSRTLVSADRLTASYYSRRQILRLHAEGHVPQYIHDIQFERLITLGGLKFDLFGWAGFGIPEVRKYERNQDFIIPNLPIVAPTNQVSIVTANHPQGLLVPIRWIGLSGEPIEQPLSLAGSVETSKTLDHNTTTIKVLFKEPFDIKETIDVTPGSTVRAQFNDKALVIQNAGYEDGNLKWTLNTLETGTTQFIVLKTHGLTDVITRKVYNIEVFVLDNAVTTSDLQNLSLTTTTTSTTGVPDPDGLLYTFKDRLTVATLIMGRHDPSAELIKIKATRGGYTIPLPVHDANQLPHLEAHFTSPQGLWRISSEGGMTWSTPKLKRGQGIVGLVPFEVQDLEYDIVGAVARMRGDGYGLPFWYCELYTVFAKAPSDPDYVFLMADDETVWVDAKTGVIRGGRGAVRFFNDGGDGTAGEKGGEGKANANGINGGGVGAVKAIEAPLPPVGVAA